MAGVLMVFFWMLWGDFTMCIMESVIPGVLSLTLEKHFGASNAVMILIISQINDAMNFMVNPAVSFRSDRYRGRWGRRIPFLFWPTPAIALILITLAFAPEIGRAAPQFLHSWLGVNGTTILVIGFLVTTFQFFNMFIGSTYYYLFNDAVPEKFMGRFSAFFRIFGTLAGIAYNLWMFPYVLSHTRYIFFAGAAVYLIGFIQMCVGLKEGIYPPPPPLIKEAEKPATEGDAARSKFHGVAASFAIAMILLGGLGLLQAPHGLGSLSAGVIALGIVTLLGLRWTRFAAFAEVFGIFFCFCVLQSSGIPRWFGLCFVPAVFINAIPLFHMLPEKLRDSIRTYFKECYTHPHYLWMFGMGASLWCAGKCGAVATLWFLHLPGCNLVNLGQFSAILQLVSILFMIPLGWFSDKVHPVRVVTFTIMWFPVISLVSFFYIHDYNSMVVMALLGTADNWFYAAAVIPMMMMIFPKERYGQFGSAEAIARTTTGLVMASVAGLFLDQMKVVYQSLSPETIALFTKLGIYVAGPNDKGPEDYRRWMYVWTTFFQILACICAWKVYRGWKRHGGRDYVPPSVGPVAGEAAPAGAGQA
jgi:MFS family permease